MKVLTWFSLLTAPLLPAEASRRQGVCVFEFAFLFYI